MASGSELSAVCEMSLKKPRDIYPWGLNRLISKHGGGSSNVHFPRVYVLTHAYITTNSLELAKAFGWM